ncbi:phage tail tape measure protein [Trabulsiella odontotermitis]|uniref:phage tail tape measure protein n=1 Tax=Trabulsiella odontotermitis TaxID=379893 RepID=UPI0006764042|nr:phage tail tape measure protein [Trabulsiella odontotermitis]
MSNLNIRVAFSAINKLSSPVNAARQSVGGLAESLKKTQSAIKDLDSQAKGFNRLKDSVQKTSTKINETSRTLEGLNKAQRDGTQLTDKQREHMSALAAKLERLNATRTKEMEKLRLAGNALRSHGVSLEGGNRTIESAIRRTEQYNQTLDRERRQLAALTQAQARYSRAKEVGDKLQSAGMKTTATGIATLAPVAAAVKSYSSVANGDDPWEKQKSDLLSFANTAAMASKAFELPAEQLSESLGKIAGLYKIPIQDIGKLGDVINYLDDNAKSKGSDIIDVLQRVGGAADQLGYQNAAALGSTFLSLGEQSETASSAVKAMVRELGNAMVQPDKFFDGLNTLGLNAEKVQQGIAKDAMGTIMTVMDATKKLDPDKQLNVLSQLFGDEYAMAISKISNNLPELRRQLELTHTTASKGSMKRESDIDKDSLSSQFQITKAALGNDFSALGETLRGPLMEIMQSIAQVLRSIRTWIEANPELTASIMKFVAGVGIALAVIGALMMAVGSVIGPLALMRLSFTVLAGGGGIGKLLPAVGRLGGAFQWLSSVGGSSLTSFRGWGTVFGSMSSGIGRLSGLLAPLRGMLFAAFMSPLSAVSSLTRGIGGLVLRLSGLPAIWSMITSSVSLLGGALSFLLSPVGIVGAVFVGAAMLIWKYWSQISAFFSGVFSGISQQLTPLRDSFARFSPIFDAIGDAISRVWNWFKELFTPVNASKETLEKCTSAGEAFGNVLGAALQLVLTPANMLLDALSWILEKLGVLPGEAEKARKNIEAAQKSAVIESMVPGLVTTGTAGNGALGVASTANGLTSTLGVTSAANGLIKTLTSTSPVGGGTGHLSGSNGNLKKIADNTGGILNETKKQRVGPGDIVFKNLPRALAVRGEWQESRLSGSSPVGAISSRPVMEAASRPVKQAELQPVSGRGGGAPVIDAGFNGDIHVHLHGVARQDAREIGALVADAVSAELARRDRFSRSSFRDKD